MLRGIAVDRAVRYVCVCVSDCSESSTRASDSEIVDVSEVLYSLDSNKASVSELVIDPQTLINHSDTGNKNDLSPLP